ncbi:MULTISPECIES: hypothetical protein [unclassified Chryseobacterium]|uniref:hypothetical protein n=1 Tax=unclassified Chryseobacterium TaxID=2593645 RepID=UPI00100BF326|nr:MULTISPECIES: hypothetical protein [unclassified Chryseobacterium]RXM50333.1 hypothetical protein BOQ64_18060 [Chryseobacterium sp. CH25]RXM64475.1 hypothetical protein BOQ60_09550 [Chryseobacterium sp. CH1]
MESNTEIEIDKSSKRIIKIFIAVFVGIFVITILYLIINSNELVKRQLLSIERYTRVIDIYNNKKEHNFPYVKYSNGTQKVLGFSYQIGDSVSKSKGDSVEYIFRKDSIIVYNLFEESRKNGYLK